MLIVHGFPNDVCALRVSHDSRIIWCTCIIKGTYTVYCACVMLILSFNMWLMLDMIWLDAWKNHVYNVMYNVYKNNRCTCIDIHHLYHCSLSGRGNILPNPVALGAR